MLSDSPETQTTHDYSSTIKILSWVTAMLAGVVAIAALGVLATQAGQTEDLGDKISKQKSIFGLLVLPVGGYMLGMAIAMLFAPRSYLESEDGQYWMRMVGTKTVTSARVVSFIFSALGIAFLVFILLAIVTDDFKNPVLGEHDAGDKNLVSEVEMFGVFAVAGLERVAPRNSDCAAGGRIQHLLQ